MKCSIVVCAVVAVCAAVKIETKEPMYNYRYDRMEAAASTIPYQGYQGIQGGLGGIGGVFYPGYREIIGGGGIGSGYGVGGIAGAGIGAGGLGAGGYGVGGVSGAGIGAAGLGAGGYGVGGVSGAGIGAGGLGVGGYGIGGIGAGGIGLGGVGVGAGQGVGLGGVGIGAGHLIGLGGGQLGLGGAGGVGLGLSGAGLGIGGAGIGVGGAGIGGAGLGGGGAGLGAGVGLGGFGGGYLNKNLYSGENKNVNGHTVNNIHANNGQAGQSGAEGFSHGEVALKDIKGDTGYYNDQQGGKKIIDHGNTMNGGQHFNAAGGKNEGENLNTNHRKGHVTKGYKSSHHKDESGETATYYDEANDEGGKFFTGGNQGSFGNHGQSAFKGVNELGQFAGNQAGKQGHYNNEHIVDNANTGKGQYGQKGYHSGGEVYSLNNGAGEQSLLGRQEANGVFLKHHPYGYVPIYGGY